MTEARMRGTPNRAAIVLTAFVAGALLGGCTGEPGPTPTQPKPPATTAGQATTPPQPTTTATNTTTATRPPSNSALTAQAPSFLRELRTMLEGFGEGMLEAGAPAVLIEAKVGQEKWSYAAGARSRDGVPVQATDPVQVGDITQSMVAASVLKLVDEGRVSLDQPVTAYLPELEGLLNPPRPVSVRQLLGHTSGMPDYYTPLLQSVPPRQVLAAQISPQQRLALAGSVPWRQQEQQEFSFSRSDYVALGLLVERLRGVPLADVLRAEIVEPLGLQSTAMIGDGPAPPNLVHGYTLVDGGLVDAAYPALLSGSATGGMISTLEDVNAFYRALLRGELISWDRVVEMKGSVDSEYGLGLYQWSDACTNGFYYGHFGDIPGYGAVAVSSADGSRQLAMSVAYPPASLSTRPNAIALEMAGVAEDALNTSCRGLQFQWDAALD